MHKYNNQDHSMMTSILTVENIIYNKKFRGWFRWFEIWWLISLTIDKLDKVFTER